MWRWIKESLSKFSKEFLTYKEGYAEFKNLKIKIHECLVKDKNTLLSDYFTELEWNQAAEVLDHRRKSLNTKMEKLNQNNATLKDVFESISSFNQIDQKEINQIFSSLESIFTEISKIGEETGLNIFEKQPELLKKEDHHWNLKHEGERKLYEKLTKIINEGNIWFDKIKEIIVNLHDSYVTQCKQEFDKLSKINTALVKNEEERIKTLKMYEMFKREYIIKLLVLIH